MQLSDAGLQLIKDFEGLRLTAYQDIGGTWTIGYGHTGADAKKGNTITNQKAHELLTKDVASFVQCVTTAVKVSLNQNQFDALVSFTFNLGCGSLKSSTLLKFLNAGDYVEAANQFERWKFVNGVEVAGLLRRRKAERDLFLFPVIDQNAPALSWDEEIAQLERIYLELGERIVALKKKVRP